jgi:hypothetical protein
MAFEKLPKIPRPEKIKGPEKMPSFQEEELNKEFIKRINQQAIEIINRALSVLKSINSSKKLIDYYNEISNDIRNYYYLRAVKEELISLYGIPEGNIIQLFEVSQEVKDFFSLLHKLEKKYKNKLI